MTITKRTPVEELEGEYLDWAVWQELGFRTADDDHVYTPHNYGVAVCHIDDWAPSEDLRHAWSVVEALNAEGWYLGLSQPYPSDGDFGVTACFNRDPEEKYEYLFNIAETAPEAICRAALRVARM